MDAEGSNLYRRVLSGFAWQGASKVVVQAISWVSTIVVARLLVPADYGIIAVANVFLWLLMSLTDMGLSQALVQKTDVTQEEEDAVFYLSVTMGAALFVVLYLAAPYIATFYNMPALTAVLQVAGVGLVIGSLKAVPQARVLRKLDFKARAFVDMAASFASTLVVLGLAYAGYGVWSLVFGLLAAQIVGTLGYLPALRHIPRPQWRLARIRGLVRYGVHLMGANLAFMISNRSDVFIIGKFLGEHITGIYSLAFTLATLPLDKIGTIFNHVAFPALSRVKDKDAQCRTLFLEMHRYLLFIAYPVLIGLATVAEDAVAVLLTQKWLAIVPVLQVLCVVNVIRVSGMLISPTLNSRGKERQALTYSLTGMVALPTGFFVGVQFGLKGVAVAWMVVYPLLYAMLLRYLHADLGIRLTDVIGKSRSTLVATGVMAAAVLFFQAASGHMGHGARLAGSILVGAAVYISVFILFYSDQVVRMREAIRALRG